MYEYITIAQLRQRNSTLLAGARAVKVARASARSPEGSTFLSHSTADQDVLPAVITLLEEHGASVYTDKMDASLPPYTSRDTAAALKRRIGQCSKLIVFATSRSIDSRWIPWELGLSDGVKGTTRVAVLPGVDNANDTAWTEREYLGIYNRIVFGDLQGRSQKVWMVLNQEANTATELREWLK